ncbi:MAG: type IV toxin-antitoxin system AbiEi family antitoxin domain-containing protein [Solirubrobacteraceae bacterium]|jgi:predicted transcriptional regulator of viral defense system
MTRNVDYIARPLSARESQIIGWLEEERPRLITASELTEVFGLPRARASDVLRRMAEKGWMQRVAQGAYEPLLAESGGIALPNPWAALAAWKPEHYVSFGAAAYELGLTPDRAAMIAVCVRPGTSRPERFSQLPIELVRQRYFSARGSGPREVAGVQVRIAGVERLLVDCALSPARVGGAIALGRIVDRALDEADWRQVVSLAEDHPRGHAAARRLAALLVVLERQVPEPLDRFASQSLPARAMPLDDRERYGWRGPTLERFGVVLNVTSSATAADSDTVTGSAHLWAGDRSTARWYDGSPCSRRGPTSAPAPASTPTHSSR